MSEIMNDRLDDLDDLRNLGEDDNDISSAQMDEAPETVDTGDAPVDEPVMAAETTDQADSLDDEADDSAPVDEPVMAAETTDEADSLDDEAADSAPVDDPVMATETTDEADTASEEQLNATVAATNEEEAASPVESTGTESDKEEAPVAAIETASESATPAPSTPVSEKEPVAPAPVATTESTDTAAPAIAEKASPAPLASVEKTEAAAPVASTGTANGENGFNPTLALRIFLFLRHAFIVIFDIVLTGVAIVLEYIMALNWGWLFGTIGDAFKSIHHMIANRLPKSVRIGLYALLAVLFLGIPSGLGIYSLISGTSNSPATAQTINVSHNNTIAHSGIIAPLFTPAVQQWAEEIAVWTNGTNITPDLFAVIMQLESCGNPSVEGGLFGVRDGNVSNPDVEAAMALAKLQSALSLSNGDLSMALAIYADGERVLTEDFGLWTLHARDMYFIGQSTYTEAQAGYTSSPDLNSWLNNTGNLMCSEARVALNN